MKSFGQFFALLVIMWGLIELGRIIAEAFDEVEFNYDPSTGRQSFKARKSRALKSASPLTLEG